MELTDKLFQGQGISKNTVYGLIIKKISSDYLNGYNFKVSCLESYSLLLFLYHLNVFPDILEKNKIISKSDKSCHKVTTQNKDYNDELEIFFQSHPLLNTTSKKAIFLIGVLIEKLLIIQYQERGSKPFQKQLKSFKLRQKDIQILFTKAINKLEQYGKNYYKELEKWIAFYLTSSNEDWAESSGEINYYLVLGMSLTNYFSNTFFTKKQEK